MLGAIVQPAAALRTNNGEPKVCVAGRTRGQILRNSGTGSVEEALRPVPSQFRLLSHRGLSA